MSLKSEISKHQQTRTVLWDKYFVIKRNSVYLPSQALDCLSLLKQEGWQEFWSLVSLRAFSLLPPLGSSPSCCWSPWRTMRSFLPSNWLSAHFASLPLSSSQTETSGSWWTQGCSLGSRLTYCGPEWSWLWAGLYRHVSPPLSREILFSPQEAQVSDSEGHTEQLVACCFHTGDICRIFHFKTTSNTFLGFASTLIFKGFWTGAVSTTVVWYLLNTHAMFIATPSAQCVEGDKGLDFVVTDAVVFLYLATSCDTDMTLSCTFGSVQVAGSPNEGKLSDWFRFRLLFNSMTSSSTQFTNKNITYGE